MFAGVTTRANKPAPRIGQDNRRTDRQRTTLTNTDTQANGHTNDHTVTHGKPGGEFLVAAYGRLGGKVVSARPQSGEESCVVRCSRCVASALKSNQLKSIWWANHKMWRSRVTAVTQFKSVIPIHLSAKSLWPSRLAPSSSFT